MGRVANFAQSFFVADLNGKRALSEHLVRRGVARVRYGNVSRRLEQGDEWVLARPPFGREGEMYLLSLRDNVIGRQLLIDGEWEFDHFHQTLSILRWSDVDLLIDVGANIGTVCIPALHRGLALGAVAIEPDATNTTLLRANALVNGVHDRLDVYEVAAAAEPGDLLLALDTQSSNFGDHQIVGSTVHAERPTVPVPGECIDNLVGSTLGTRTLLWIDVQGYEGSALSGARRVLECGAAVVMEFSPAHLAFHGGVSGLDLLHDYFTDFVDLRSGKQHHLSGRVLSDLADSLGNGHTDLLFLPAGHRVKS